MKPASIEEYLRGFPAEKRSKLAELHEIIKKTLPDTKEALKWGSPATLDKDGMILLIFSGHKNHMNFVVTPSTKQAFETRLTDYETGKGAVKLAYDKPLPVELIKDMAAYRADEYRNHGVKWM